jgi:hypothetical protein
MLILYPKEWMEGKIALTAFGNALANGQVNKKRYYDFILTHFKYPHPAWKDNWDRWTKEHNELYPFIYILQTLVKLHEKSPEYAFLTTEEVADYLHPAPSHKHISEYAEDIISARESNTPAQTKKSDDIHRKISDILGFLCLTSYCYFYGNSIYLNLFDKHEIEKSNFLGKRKGQDKLEVIKNVISARPK